MSTEEHTTEITFNGPSHMLGMSVLGYVGYRYMFFVLTARRKADLKGALSLAARPVAAGDWGRGSWSVKDWAIEQHAFECSADRAWNAISNEQVGTITIEPSTYRHSIMLFRWSSRECLDLLNELNDYLKEVQGLGRPSEVQLSPIERKIFELVVQGKTAAQSARILSLSPRTIETHIANVKNRNGCRSKAQLATRLIAQGVIPYDMAGWKSS